MIAGQFRSKFDWHEIDAILKKNQVLMQIGKSNIFS
jgi:hypothetical protein